MEFLWNHFDESPKKRKKVNHTPMGPKHPMWKCARQEVENLLRQSGRIYDEGTVNAIAMDEESWNQLITDAVSNMSQITQANRMNQLTDMLGRVRNKTGLDNLFGGDTRVTGQED